MSDDEYLALLERLDRVYDRNVTLSAQTPPHHGRDLDFVTAIAQLTNIGTF